MDKEQTSRIVRNIRKRLRSNDNEQSENKRLKELIDGDLEDFIDLLDTMYPDEHKTKPDVDKSADQNINNDTRGVSASNSNSQAILSTLERLENKIDGMKEQLDKKEQRITELEKKFEKLEQVNRKNNLIIHGIPETDNENNKKQVIDFAKEQLKLDIEPTEISEAYRVGKKDSKNKPILVKFTNSNSRRNL